MDNIFFLIIMVIWCMAGEADALPLIADAIAAGKKQAYD